jgi:hypothetical protein
MKRRQDGERLSQTGPRMPSEPLCNNHLGQRWVRAHWSEAIERRYADQWVLVGPEGIVAAGSSLKVLEEELKMSRPGYSVADFLSGFIRSRPS